MRFPVVFSLLASLASPSFACAAPAATDAESDDAPEAVAESAATATGRVGTHGMVLFGSRARTYLSHIPMFQAPHDVQAIVEIELPALAANMPPTFADRLYTFVPERFSLDALRIGKVATLRGTIHLGNFEQGGRPIARNVEVKVKRVVHEHVLVATAPDSGSKYVVFGSATEAYAVHLIGGAPSKDRITTVKLGRRRPSDAALATGVAVELGDIDVTATKVLSCLSGPDFVAPCD